jgi:hypothetical protein
VVVVALGGGVCTSAASGDIGICIGVIGVRPFIDSVASIYDPLCPLRCPPYARASAGGRGRAERRLVTWRAVYID